LLKSHGTDFSSWRGPGEAFRYARRGARGAMVAPRAEVVDQAGRYVEPETGVTPPSRRHMDQAGSRVITSGYAITVPRIGLGRVTVASPWPFHHGRASLRPFRGQPPLAPLRRDAARLASVVALPPAPPHRLDRSARVFPHCTQNAVLVHFL
jgi:hypothetical protein